jgi:hypothetical protein
MSLQEALPDDLLIKVSGSAMKAEGKRLDLAKVLDPTSTALESKDALDKAIANRKKRKRMRWEKPIADTLRHSKATKDEIEKANPKFFTCGHFWGPLTIPEKHIGLLRSSIVNHFQPEVLRAQVLPFVTRSDEIPLRLLGWLVVNYVKEFPVTYEWAGPDGKAKPRVVNVLQGYNELMKRYHRRHFDPFRRKHRIFFEVDDKVYETTIGQLLFLQWAFADGVVDYARKHAKAIETHMNIYNAAKTEEKEEDKRRGVRHRRSEFVTTCRRQIGFMCVDLVEHDSEFDDGSSGEDSDHEGDPDNGGDESEKCASSEKDSDDE